MNRPRFRLLLVHDDPRTERLFRQAVSSSGGELATADSYAGAVRQVANERSDVVVLSPSLANSSRQGFARVVRNSHLNSQTSVVLLTGTQGRGSEELMLGGFSMFPRPLSPEDLVPFFKQMTRAFQAERRKHRRLPFRVSVHCVKGLERFQATSVNLGSTGVLLDVRYPVRPNEELELHFNLEAGGPDLRARARAVRSHSPTRVAVAFQGLSAQERLRIGQFIDRHLPRQV